MYKNLVYTKILKSIKASKVIYDNVIVHLAGRGRGKEQGDGADTSDLHGNNFCMKNIPRYQTGSFL